MHEAVLNIEIERRANDLEERPKLYTKVTDRESNC